MFEGVSRKLVRDNIPNIIRQEGHEPNVRVLSAEELPLALKDKLQEETKEFITAESAPERLQEAADVLAVLLAAIALDGYGIAELLTAEQQKRDVRGGFEKGYFLTGE